MTALLVEAEEGRHEPLGDQVESRPKADSLDSQYALVQAAIILAFSLPKMGDCMRLLIEI